MKDALIYRIGPVSLAMLVAVTAAHPFAETGPTQQAAIGFKPPRDAGGAMVEQVGEFLVARFVRETRKVPPAAVEKALRERAKAIEDETGRPPGRKHRKELKEEVTLALLPHAFPRAKAVDVVIDTKHGLLFIGATTAAIVDPLLSILSTDLMEHDPDLSIRPALSGETMVPIDGAMRAWVTDGLPEDGQLRVGDSCRLQDPEDSKATITYHGAGMEGDEVPDRIRQGMMVKSVRLVTNGCEFAISRDGAMRGIWVNVPTAPPEDVDAFDADVVLTMSGISAAARLLADELTRDTNE